MRKILYGLIAAAAVVLLAFMLLSERYVNAVRGRKLSQLAEEEREKSIRLEELRKELDTLEKATKVKDVQATEELVAVSLDTPLYTDLFPVMKEHKRVGVMALSPREFPGNEGKITKDQFTEMTKAGWTTCVVWDGVEPLDVFRTETEKKFKELGIAMPETVYVSLGEAVMDFAEAAEQMSTEGGAQAGAGETGAAGAAAGGSGAGETGAAGAAAGGSEAGETGAAAEIPAEVLAAAEAEAGSLEKYIDYDSIDSLESYLSEEDLIKIIGYDPHAENATPVDAERMDAAVQEQRRMAAEHQQAAIRAAEEKGRADRQAAINAVLVREGYAPISVGAASAGGAAGADGAGAADGTGAGAAAGAAGAGVGAGAGAASAGGAAGAADAAAEAYAQEKLDNLRGAAERLTNIKDEAFAEAGFRVVIGLSNEEDKQELFRPLGKTWYPLSLPWNDKGVKQYVDQVVQEKGNIVLVVNFGGGKFGYRADAFERMLKAMDGYGDQLKFTGFADAIRIHDLTEAEIKAKQAYEKRKGELEPQIEQLENEISELYNSYYGK